MEDPKVYFDVDEDRDLCLITIVNGDVEAKALCKPAFLQHLAETISDIRERMKDKVSMERDQTQPARGVNNPAWTTNLATLSETGESKPEICYRHPGLGWRSLYLRPEEARKMGQALLDLAQMADKKGAVMN